MSKNIVNERGIDPKKLMKVLYKMFGTEILSADFQTRQLHGGTLGDVKLVSGMVKTAGGETLPYSVVWKTQMKWERGGDPGSWRREYDLYTSGLSASFTGSFRWPECYLAEINDDENEIQIWMEYIDGVTGPDLTGDMYERAAFELGRFQGKLYAERPPVLYNLTNLGKSDYMKSFYLRYRSWDKVYDYIRSGGCGIPAHICKMLIDIDENADALFDRIGKLPLVLCHRDFWVANIFCADGGVALIDWDTCGWGYLGEDIASLVADEADVEHMVEYYRRCVAAYYRGFAEYADISPAADNCVREMILLMYGYRLVEWYLNADSDDKKALQLDTLQKIHDMGVSAGMRA